MIATIVIDHLLNKIQNSSVGVAYVYFNYKAREEQDATSLLAAMLKQLVQARPSLLGGVEQLYLQHADKGTKPSLDEISKILEPVLVNHSTVYIVIDALDECRDSDGTRWHLLVRLRELQTRTNLRLMVTSRNMPEIVEEFQEERRLEVKASNEDVKLFVAGQIYRLPKCIQRDSLLQDIVQEKIVEAVDGMYGFSYLGKVA
jgi:hypothetical protein